MVESKQSVEETKQQGKPQISVALPSAPTAGSQSFANLFSSFFSGSFLFDAFFQNLSPIKPPPAPEKPLKEEVELPVENTVERKSAEEEEIVVRDQVDQVETTKDAHSKEKLVKETPKEETVQTAPVPVETKPETTSLNVSEETTESAKKETPQQAATPAFFQKDSPIVTASGTSLQAKALKVSEAPQAIIKEAAAAPLAPESNAVTGESRLQRTSLQAAKQIAPAPLLNVQATEEKVLTPENLVPTDTQKLGDIPVQAMRNVFSLQNFLTGKQADIRELLGPSQNVLTVPRTSGTTPEVPSFQNRSLDKGAQNNERLANTSKTLASNQQQILERIEKAIETALKSRTPDTLTFRLEPSELGQVNVKVTQRSGQVYARLTPESPEVEALIRAKLPELTQLLTAAGLKLDNVHVSVGAEKGESEFAQFNRFLEEKNARGGKQFGYEGSAPESTTRGAYESVDSYSPSWVA